MTTVTYKKRPSVLRPADNLFGSTVWCTVCNKIVDKVQLEGTSGGLNTYQVSCHGSVDIIGIETTKVWRRGKIPAFTLTKEPDFEEDV